MDSKMSEQTGEYHAETRNQSSKNFFKLSCEITRLAESVRQSHELFKRKKLIRQIIYNTLRNHSVQPLDLYLVGSSLNGLGTAKSDIDLCLVMNSFGVGYCHMRVAVPILRWAEKILSKLPFVKNTKLILAKVPILKFTDAESGLDVDLNFNNIVGIRNTQLIEFYSRMDRRVQPLVVTVKTWARQNNINSARSRTISSYSFVLMVIHYLQCGCEPAALPCLHKMMPGKFTPESDITKLSLYEDVPKFKSANNQTLGELFVGFLHYYGHKFDFSSNVISIRTGGVIPKFVSRELISSKNNPRHWGYICVEEPFDRTNTAKSVYDKDVFMQILQTFKESHEKILQTGSLMSVMSIQTPYPERFLKVNQGCDGYPARKVRLHDHYQPYYIYSQQSYMQIVPHTL